MVIDSQASCIHRGGGQEGCVFESRHEHASDDGVLLTVSNGVYIIVLSSGFMYAVARCMFVCTLRMC